MPVPSRRANARRRSKTSTQSRPNAGCTDSTSSTGSRFSGTPFFSASRTTAPTAWWASRKATPRRTRWSARSVASNAGSATAAAHGLPPEEALKAITLYPARILGVADRLGALAPGLLASFIVTDGDPLELSTQVERAFIQGREIELSNRQTRLTEKYRQKYEQLRQR